MLFYMLTDEVAYSLFLIALVHRLPGTLQPEPFLSRTDASSNL